MQPAAALTALSLAFAASSLGSAVAGVLVIGIGSGDAVLGGEFFCDDVTFTTRALFLPNGKGLLDFLWTDATGCLAQGDPFLGGYVAIGDVVYDLNGSPPATFEYSCSGSESQGLDCGVVRIGPYNGLGGKMWLYRSDEVETFFGEFTAV